MSIQFKLPLRLQRCCFGNALLPQLSRVIPMSNYQAAPRNTAAHTRYYHPSYALRSSISDGPGISPISAPTSTPISQEEKLPLYGRTAFITGGSAGIGLAIAMRFLKEGAGRVVIVGRDRMKLLSALRDLDGVVRSMKVEGRSLGPADEFAKLEEAEGPARPIDPMDHRAGCERGNANGSSQQPPRSEGEPEILHYRHVTLVVGDISMSEFYSSELISVLDASDILVNAAGVSRSSLLPRATAEGIHEMTNTNLVGTVLACRHYIRRLLKKKAMGARKQKAVPHEVLEKPNFGMAEVEQDVVAADDCPETSILNISSLQATNPTTGALVYAATKAGIISLTQGIVNEVSNMKSPLRLRANVLVPGYVDTSMLHELGPDMHKIAREKIPVGRVGTPEEIADAAFFLTSNGYCNGTVLNIDGGLGCKTPI